MLECWSKLEGKFQHSPCWPTLAYVLTPERFTITNPEHVDFGHHVQRMLATRGLLRVLV
ncbi:Imm52 family immunity protein [Archangium lansingense]|uniref:Imm52 family immunity protein n=1 Tax=Archangium lansingense TaxID=2995310 RepID=UPI00358DC7DF